MTRPRHTLVVSLWIHPGQEAEFEAFEREAAALMARYGGRIEQAIRIDDAGGQGGGPFEVHVVSFPDRAAAESYRADPEVRAKGSQRAAIIARTEVLEGYSAGPY